jgi:predicted dehydrogenase
MKLRVALVGAGYWGSKLARAFGQLDEVELCLIVDHDLEHCRALSATCPISTQADDVWANEGIDAVVIATPPVSHYALARSALEARKHCWVEKPMTLSTEHAEDLVQLARQQSRTLFVDETFLYDPLVEQARRWIAENRLGRLYHLSFQRLGMGRVRRDSDIWWNSASHDLSILRYLVPTPVHDLQVERFSYLQSGIADMCVATLRLEDEVSVHVYVSWLSPIKQASLVAVGSSGMLRYEGRFGQRQLAFYDYSISNPPRPSGNVLPIEGFRATQILDNPGEEPLKLAAKAFIQSIRTGTATPSDGAQSLQTVRLLAAADGYGFRRDTRSP